MPTSPFLTFSVSDQRFCIDVSNVQEIATLEDFRDVPQAPSCIKGISSLRGKIITLVELGNIFQISCDQKTPFHAVILSPPHANIALSVYSAFTMREGTFQTEERNGKPFPSKQIEMEGQIALLLQPADIVSYCEKKILDLFKVGRTDSGNKEKRKHFTMDGLQHEKKCSHRR